MDNKKIKIKSNYFSKVKGRIKDLMIIKEDSMFLGHPVRPRWNINIFFIGLLLFGYIIHWIFFVPGIIGIVSFLFLNRGLNKPGDTKQEFYIKVITFGIFVVVLGLVLFTWLLY